VQNTFEFSDEERQLLLQLLDKERHELPSEIHHTDRCHVREDLKRRLQAVERLLERLQGIAVK